jgi:hypothetical protein
MKMCFRIIVYACILSAYGLMPIVFGILTGFTATVLIVRNEALRTFVASHASQAVIVGIGLIGLIAMLLSGLAVMRLSRSLGIDTWIRDHFAAERAFLQRRGFSRKSDRALRRETP